MELNDFVYSDHQLNKVLHKINTKVHVIRLQLNQLICSSILDLHFHICIQKLTDQGEALNDYYHVRNITGKM
jgi:hypothetical protein